MPQMMQSKHPRSGLPSPRTGLPSPRASPRRGPIDPEKRERKMQVDKLTTDLTDANRKIEAMQLTLMDFQVVLTSHEREVEGLWNHQQARGGPGGGGGVGGGGVSAAEMAEMKRHIAMLTDRLEVAETRALLPAVGAHPQSRELVETFDAKLKATQDAALREADRVDSQLSQFREALHSIKPLNDSTELISRLKHDVEQQLGEVATKAMSQQLAVVDVDRRLSDKMNSLQQHYSTLAGNVNQVGDEGRLQVSSMQGLQGHITAIRDEQQRSADDMRNSQLAFQEQCSEMLQRHSLDIKEKMQKMQQDMRQQLHTHSDKAMSASRIAEGFRSHIDDLTGQAKRLQSQLHEAELGRKEDIRRVQQQTSDSCSRVQQALSSDVHRLQKETSQDLQRFEDSSSSLYRTVEELRGVQQRTLEEYHRQGDEQSVLHAKFQQQLTDINSILKEQLQSESDKLQALLRTETQSLNDHIVRTKSELGERVGTTERRLTDNENVIDSFRGRIRTLEMNDSSKLEKNVEDMKQRQAAQDSRVHVLEGWRSEAVAKLVSMEGRLNEAGNASQLATLGRRVDEVERGLVLCRGPEREDLKRNLKVELDDKFSLFEGHFTDGLESMKTRIQTQETSVRDISRDVAKELVRVKQNTEKISQMEETMKQQMRVMKENIEQELEPKIEGCHQKMTLLQKDLDALRNKNTQFSDQVKSLRNEEQERMLENQQEVAKLRKEVTTMKHALEEKIFSGEAKLAELKRLFDSLYEDSQKKFEDFGKLREELQQNNEEDEKREENIKKMIRDIVHLRDSMSKEIEDMKNAMAMNRKAYEKRQEELNMMLAQYSEEFNKTRADLNENAEADERREKHFAESVQKLHDTVDAKNREAIEEMRMVHSEMVELGNGMTQEFAGWRDRVVAAETQVKQLTGFVDQLTEMSENTSLEVTRKLTDFESRLNTEMGKVRRALEKKTNEMES